MSPQCTPTSQIPYLTASQLPPPGEKEWEVECIDNARRRYRKLQFLVKWKGWSNADWTWEPVENLAHAPEAIAKFYCDHPNATH